MSRADKILMISRDPGGTNMLVAIRDNLLGDRNDGRDQLFDFLGLTEKPHITPLAKDYAGAIWQQYDIEATVWPALVGEDDLADWIAGFGPDQIITSTGYLDDRTEQMVWRLARKRGIDITAFLDSSHNLPMRFRNDQGQVILPDRVAVLDKEDVYQMQSLGLPARAILVMNDPYGSFVRTRQHKVDRGVLHQEWQVEPGEMVILFASDYVQEMQARGVVFEVTEFDCLDSLLRLLQKGEKPPLPAAFKPPFRVIIRPHPKDRPGKYQAYPMRSTDQLTIIISDQGSAHEAILSVDMVAGLGSSLLQEAEHLGVAQLKLAPLVTFYKDQ